MDLQTARVTAEEFLRMHPPGEPDAVLVDVQEHERAFVAFWSTQRSVASRDPRDAPAPGTGPIAVPKDGSSVRYLGSQRLDAALAQVGLGPEPVRGASPDWGG